MFTHQLEVVYVRGQLQPGHPEMNHPRLGLLQRHPLQHTQLLLDTLSYVPRALANSLQLSKTTVVVVCSSKTLTFQSAKRSLLCCH